MCGISGYIKIGNKPLPVNHKKIMEQMLSKIVHRGPDDVGVYKDDAVHIGMRRLIIIDKKNGSQPMKLNNDNYIIVFNGEIFNYRELREELIKDNVVFISNSDTEVLLQMYIRYGFDCIKRIKGMFAFCIYDKKNKTTWIARDRFGIKPLYYSVTDDFLCFGSSLESISSAGLINNEISKDSLDLYLLISYIPTPRTIYKNIFKLEPGQQLIIKNKKVLSNKYWDINDYVNGEDCTNIESYLESLLDTSIKEHAVADQPIGTYLSGGLDSSVITKKYHRLCDKNFNSYTANFTSKDNSDAFYARKVSKHLKINHTDIEIDSSMYLHELDMLIKYLDEPVYDSSMVASYMIAKNAQKDGVKVLLAGNGADEIFGGYMRHYESPQSILRGKLNFMPNIFIDLIPNYKMLKHKMLQLKYEYISYAINFSGINLHTYKKTIKDVDFFKLNNALKDYFLPKNSNKSKNIGHTKKMMLRDIKTYLVDNGLSILDKTTMGASVEGRVPYLDHQIIEYLFSKKHINVDFKNSKYLLKNMANNNNLNYISKRQKMGFNQPLEDLFDNKDNIMHVKNTIMKARHYLESILDYDGILKYFDKKYSNNSIENIMNIYCLSSWFLNKHQ